MEEKRTEEKERTGKTETTDEVSSEKDRDAPDAAEAAGESPGEPLGESVGESLDESRDPALGAPLTPRERHSFHSLRLGSRRMFLLTAAISVVLIVFLLVGEGWFWALGGFLGSAIVLGNLAVFHRAMLGSEPTRTESPLWVTILKFYGLFVLTIALAALIIIFGIGNPFGFLAGLMVFLPSFFGTLIWMAASAALAKRGKTRGK
ncbi:MAG: ATP synthase subunit I [Deltaproteobacteria bacterium]|jgi:hypothetical protein|nr:ATP synthase subunit I [Deltaproteobacteria bacterium]